MNSVFSILIYNSILIYSVFYIFYHNILFYPVLFCILYSCNCFILLPNSSFYFLLCTFFFSLHPSNSTVSSSCIPYPPPNSVSCIPLLTLYPVSPSKLCILYPPPNSVFCFLFLTQYLSYYKLVSFSCTLYPLPDSVSFSCILYAPPDFVSFSCILYPPLDSVSFSCILFSP